MTPPPTDTPAALWSAIRYAAGDFIRDGDEQAIDRAITAHIEAEVARRLAAAPDVEAAIVRHDDATYWRGYRHGGGKVPPDWEDVPRDDHALRAAIAADKARAVEAAEDAAFIRGRDAVRKYPDGWGLVARPTPDEARRLVEALHLDLLATADTVAALHGAVGTGLRNHCVAAADNLRLTADTARTALLRALGVEA